MPLATYLAVPPGSLRDACESALGGVVVDDLQELLPADGRAPGIVVVDPGAWPVAEVARLALALHRSGPGWTVAILTDDDPPALRSLSVGLPHALADVASHAADPGGHPGTLMELRRVLDEVARARHDVNNPLTSALAETQLLLLDDHGDEVQESLSVIQDQLRRMRDLIAATGHIRLPKR